VCVAGSEGEGLVSAAVRGGFGEGSSEIVLWFQNVSCTICKKYILIY
jgi:hypothetical protein